MRCVLVYQSSLFWPRWFHSHFPFCSPLGVCQGAVKVTWFTGTSGLATAYMILESTALGWSSWIQREIQPLGCSLRIRWSYGITSVEKLYTHWIWWGNWITFTSDPTFHVEIFLVWIFCCCWRCRMVCAVILPCWAAGIWQPALRWVYIHRYWL